MAFKDFNKLMLMRAPDPLEGCTREEQGGDDQAARRRVGSPSREADVRGVGAQDRRHH